MGFRFHVCSVDGNVLSAAEYGYEPDPGDEVIVDGNRRMRVRSVIPVALAGEFVDRPLYGLLEVEPTSCPAYTGCERLRDLSGPPRRLWVCQDSLDDTASATQRQDGRGGRVRSATWAAIPPSGNQTDLQTGHFRGPVGAQIDARGVHVQRCVTRMRRKRRAARPRG
jgi:hypothetical protein